MTGIDQGGCRILEGRLGEPRHGHATISKIAAMPEAHRNYWVYILTNKPHGTLYIGVTNSLERRTWQHKVGSTEGFTRRYGLNRMVHIENFRGAANAIAREKELKGWLRSKKIALIQAANPLWKDLAEGWYSIQVDPSLRSG